MGASRVGTPTASWSGPKEPIHSGHSNRKNGSGGTANLPKVHLGTLVLTLIERCDRGAWGRGQGLKRPPTKRGRGPRGPRGVGGMLHPTPRASPQMLRQEPDHCMQ
eukprot:790576-Pyramimonas_sp.AAC.1